MIEYSKFLQVACDASSLCLQIQVDEESDVELDELKDSPVENEPVSMEHLTAEELDFDTPRRGQLREGIIADIRDEGIVVDIGGKRDGFVPLADLQELEPRPEFKIGQAVPVIVTQPRNHEGNVELSIAQAQTQEDWLKAEQLKTDETVYEANVLEANRGGLTVEFGRLRGFVPMSQLIGFSKIRQASERYRRLNAMVGKTILLKVIEVNRRRRRLILSQQAAAKEWRAERRRDLLEELEAGQPRTGRVSQITEFGLFVNLGGLDGLVHISELSWGRIENPAEVYRPGQRVKVKVLSVDQNRQRIALSIKALVPDPWDSAPERYAIGALVEGKVSQVADFGIFVELEPGVEGLLHNSELAAQEQREELEVGARVLVKVIRVEPERRRIGLSVRQVRRQEWEEWYAAAEAARAAAASAPAVVAETEADFDDDFEAGDFEAETPGLAESLPVVDEIDEAANVDAAVANTESDVADEIAA